MNSTPYSASFCTPAWFHRSSGAHEHRPSNADVAQGIAAPALHLRYMAALLLELRVIRTSC